MWTANSTYYEALAKHSKEREEFVELLRLAKADSEKKTSALTQTTRKLEQANDDLKSVTKEYRDLKRAVKGDFKKVYDLAQEVIGREPKELWTHSSGRPIPLAESRISKMVGVLSRHFKMKMEVVQRSVKEKVAMESSLQESQAMHEKVLKEVIVLKELHAKEQKDVKADYKEITKKFEMHEKLIEKGKGQLLTVQNDLIQSQNEVARLKDLLLQRDAEIKKLSQELDSRFCRFVDTLTGGVGKKRKVASLTLRDGEVD